MENSCRWSTPGEKSFEAFFCKKQRTNYMRNHRKTGRAKFWLGQQGACFSYKCSVNGLLRGSGKGNLLTSDNFSPNKHALNRPFPSYPSPLFQNESTCETIHMKMCSTFTSIFMQIKLIFIWMVWHVDSFRSWGKRQLGNGLLREGDTFSIWERSKFVDCWTKTFHGSGDVSLLLLQRLKCLIQSSLFYPYFFNF